MKLHGNARTCPNSRRLLIERVLEEGWSVSAAAAAARQVSHSEREVGKPGLDLARDIPLRSPRQLSMTKVQAMGKAATWPQPNGRRDPIWWLVLVHTLHAVLNEWMNKQMDVVLMMMSDDGAPSVW